MSASVIRSGRVLPETVEGVYSAEGSGEMDGRPGVQRRGCGCGGRPVSHLLWEVTS